MRAKMTPFFIFYFYFQAQLPHVKVHAYFAPVTPPPAVAGGGQRLCRCCVIL
jgi:F-box/leucine-rich repeat protein 2/20